MIDFHEALQVFQEINFHLAVEEVSLNNSYMRVLGEDIFSDINIPPFDKSAMDGYACRKSDLSGTLQIIETLHAGHSTEKVVETGTCIKIMTGAPVPKGADTVIMFEHTEPLEGNRIRFIKDKTKSNICQLGEDVKNGDQLLKSGTLLLAHHIAVLASAGYSRLKVSQLPRVAILSTGSELVEPDTIPKGAKIRNSNAYNLLAQLKQMNIQADYAGIIPDSKKSISEKLGVLIEENDLVLLTGGASAGEHDFVPDVLKELGLDLRFDRLAIQPGKPVSFAATDKKFCFGLSGNPVSSFLQFDLLVKPFIYRIMKHKYEHPIQLAPLALALERKRADRLKFFPVKLNPAGQAEEVKFNGSAHIGGLTYADGFGLFPKDCQSLAADEFIEVLRIK